MTVRPRRSLAQHARDDGRRGGELREVRRVNPEVPRALLRTDDLAGPVSLVNFGPLKSNLELVPSLEQDRTAGGARSIAMH
jgi:hypothetical protein